MKKIVSILITLFCLTGSLSYAQSPQSNNSENKEDLTIKHRLFVDFFTTFWLDLPEGVEQKGFNRGFNAALLYDIPVKKDSPFSFGLGVGVCSHNLYSNAYTYINDNYNVVMEAFPANTDYRINKLSFTYLHIPLEFRYINPKNEFRIGAGIRVGLIADIHTKYVGENTSLLQYQTGVNRDVQIKSNKIPNKNKMPIEMTFYAGWKYFDINFSYMLTKFFEEDNPQMHPLSIGVSISLW